MTESNIYKKIPFSDKLRPLPNCLHNELQKLQFNQDVVVKTFLGLVDKIDTADLSIDEKEILAQLTYNIFDGSNSGVITQYSFTFDQFLKLWLHMGHFFKGKRSPVSSTKVMHSYRATYMCCINDTPSKKNLNTTPRPYAGDEQVKKRRRKTPKVPPLECDGFIEVDYHFDQHVVVFNKVIAHKIDIPTHHLKKKSRILSHIAQRKALEGRNAGYIKTHIKEIVATDYGKVRVARNLHKLTPSIDLVIGASWFDLGEEQTSTRDVGNMIKDIRREQKIAEDELAEKTKMNGPMFIAYNPSE